MTGRIEEKAYLDSVINDPLRSGALVAGQAGVGKTRLVREVTERTADRRVEFVTATHSARLIPFGAVAHLLPEDLEQMDRVDLLAAIGRHLLRRAGGKQIVLAVDDIHLLDDYSAAFVHHVVVAKLATVLLTLRSGELAPDALTTWHRDGVFSRLELQPISRSEFEHLIELVLDGQVENRTLENIWTVTKGNVLFIRELIDDAIEAGELVCINKVWRWTGGLGIAPRLHETVAARLVGLSTSERELLEILAVGEQLSRSSAERLAPEVSLHNLERRGLVAIEPNEEGTSLRFAHPLFGETLRTTMSPSSLKRIYRLLADDLANGMDLRSGDSLRLAIWKEAAGEVVDDRLLILAARNANALSDHSLAERFAQAAVLGNAGFNAALELGRALVGQNRYAEAEKILLPLVGSEVSDHDRERLADAISHALGWG